MPSYTVIDVIMRLRYKDPANPQADEVAYRRRFLELYPQTEADILSFQNNPQCECQNRIINVVRQDMRRLSEHAKLLLGDDTAVIETPRNLGGEVHTVDDVLGYTEMVRRCIAIGHVYRAITVVPMDGKLKVFFA